MTAVPVSLAEALCIEAEAEGDCPEPVKVLLPASIRDEAPAQTAEEGVTASSAEPERKRVDAAAEPQKVELSPESISWSARRRSHDDMDSFAMGCFSPLPPQSPVPMPLQASWPGLPLLPQPPCTPCREYGADAEAAAVGLRLGLATPHWVKDSEFEAMQALALSAEQETCAGSPAASSSSELESGTESDPALGEAAGSAAAALAAAAPAPPFPAPAWVPELAPDVPSQGSLLHMSGTCRPCAWFHKPVGCQSSRECVFCHLCPAGALKAKKKSKLAMKRLGLAAPGRAPHAPRPEPRVPHLG
eukprot:CAMPEP_0168464582 /NCGR_PEP_ID=MMETSP0228-20121227/55654_1 /TAXON_ID=133427 /ORGANISM="Protoceratium reticulatum, Strain CCCM 535 (=CCMP 1889)" /LENGTH=302 /DNA_ID=CAMNT_0008480091 /DNA_START=72 /DNA_END=980 /DNA_ORIENTATION=+